MKLSRKEFNIVQLVDNRQDFIINEILYIFGFSFSYCWYSLDGMNGDIPFSKKSSAKQRVEELEKQEKFDCVKRDGAIILFTSVLVAVFILLTWILNN